MSGRLRPHLLALCVFLGSAFAAPVALAQPVAVDLHLGQERSAIVRPSRGTPSLCEGSCTLDLERGAVRLELTELRRGPSPVRFELDVPARVELEIDSRRGVRIFGGAAVEGATQQVSITSASVCLSYTAPHESAPPAPLCGPRLRWLR